MASKEQDVLALDELVAGDVLTEFLVNYLRDCTPQGTLEEVLRLADESRKASLAWDGPTWTPYELRRSMLEAAAVVLGGIEALTEVGRHAFDSIRNPERIELLQSLGSPTAVYESLPKFIELYGPAFEMRTEMMGPQECRIEVRMREPNEPFPELCAFSWGLASTIPQLFGCPAAEILQESCQCAGAPHCSARLCWGEGEDARLSHAEIRVRLLEARLDELQRTVAELGSGGGLKAVLSRVMAAAMRAVQAPSFILDIKPSSTSDRFVQFEGIDDAGAARVTRGLRTAGGLDKAGSIIVSKVASARGTYGHLVALRADQVSFEPREYSVLDSYARLAAAAIDSEADVVEARRQAATATTLLALSSSLAELSTSEEMVQHLARTIPSVIDCDRVLISLDDPDGTTARVHATYGFDQATDSELRSLAQPISAGVDPSEVFWHGAPLYPRSVGSALVDAGSIRSCSFAIISNAERFGWITVSVIDNPSRLDDPTIAERLRGLAGQAAIAIHNAHLLEEIRFQALHDSLTGLPNRILILDRVEQAMARARRDHVDVALLFVDLDGFKDVNDNLGHKIGDDLLCSVAARFAGTLRESDTVARLGGDEFVVLAEGMSLAAGPDLVAQRLLEVLSEPFHLGEKGQVPVSVSASIGIAAGVRDTSEELFRDADLALYGAKEAGKNCYRIFESEMYDAMHSRHELEMDLQVAVGTDQFFLEYQPIFNLTDMSVIGAEALLRWRHPSKGLLQPDAFIPALEASGLIIPVGRWVLVEACRQAMAWLDKGQTIKMSVNASARQLDADTLFDEVCFALTESGLPAESLIIEITETCLMRDAKGALHQLNALKSLGVRIAIDDFGTGYSSLAYLQQFPVDSLKIDRTFIAGMGKSPEGDTLIHTLIQLGKALKLETLAEGIEETEQLMQLRREECDVGQGYLVSPPLAPEAIEKLFGLATPRVNA